MGQQTEGIAGQTQNGGFSTANHLQICGLILGEVHFQGAEAGAVHHQRQWLGAFPGTRQIEGHL
jgi:hypothetical protein